MEGGSPILDLSIAYSPSHPPAPALTAINSPSVGRVARVYARRQRGSEVNIPRGGAAPVAVLRGFRPARGAGPARRVRRRGLGQRVRFFCVFLHRSLISTE